jgi:hypothetical protein
MMVEAVEFWAQIVSGWFLSPGTWATVMRGMTPFYRETVNGKVPAARGPRGPLWFGLVLGCIGP